MMPIQILAVPALDKVKKIPIIIKIKKKIPIFLFDLLSEIKTRPIEAAMAISRKPAK